MARRAQYKSEKRKKELSRQKKQELKRQKRLSKDSGKNESGDVTEAGEEAGPEFHEDEQDGGDEEAGEDAAGDPD